MNQLLPMLLNMLKADKGRDVNRTLVLLGVIYCALQLESLDNRVAVIEAAHRPASHAAAASTNSLATTGPTWPAKTAAAFQ